MSILYDYLKLVEKKKKEGAVHKQGATQADTPVSIPQKRKVNLWPYLAIGFVFIAGASLFLFFKNITTSSTRWIEKTAPTRQNLSFAPQDSYTQNLDKENASVLEYSLKGIIYNAESPSAIINSQLVEKYAKIDDWQVMEISPSEVKLENTDNKSLLTLKLNSSSGQ